MAMFRRAQKFEVAYGSVICSYGSSEGRWYLEGIHRLLDLTSTMDWIGWEHDKFVIVYKNSALESKDEVVGFLSELSELILKLSRGGVLVSFEIFNADNERLEPGD